MNVTFLITPFLWLINQIRLLGLKWRLYKYQERYGVDDTSIHAMLILCNQIDYYVLNNYSRPVAKEWLFDTGVPNAEALFNWLDNLALKLKAGETIQTESVMVIFDRKYTRSIYDFLSYNDGRAMSASDCWGGIFDRLSDIFNILMQIEEKPLTIYNYWYYYPKLTALLKEVFTVLEGLLTAALNYE